LLLLVCIIHNMLPLPISVTTSVMMCIDNVSLQLKELVSGNDVCKPLADVRSLRKLVVLIHLKNCCPKLLCQ